jgi:hypothetical protein
MFILYAYMRVYRNRNLSDTSANFSLLADLSVDLRSLLEGGRATQWDIEEATGVDQTTISRAKNGRLKRVTDKIRRLHAYANMRVRTIAVSSEVAAAATAFLSVGGSEEELISSIRLATRLVLRHQRSSAPERAFRNKTL